MLVSITRQTSNCILRDEIHTQIHIN